VFGCCELYVRALMGWQVAEELLKGKATFVAVGDTSALPHADELGLSA
jgi:hypothetical protein